MKHSIIEVDHWGAHLSPDGLWFLQQQDGAQNARKLNVKSPFVVKPIRRGYCPHAISLDSGTSDLSVCNSLIQHELARLFLPLPTLAGQCAFIEQPQSFEKLLQLCELTSPVRNIMHSSWMLTDAEFKRQLTLTNLQPLVITGVTVKWMTQNAGPIEALSHSYRSSILIGDSSAILPSHVRRYKAEALEEIGSSALCRATGATILRAFMRDELETA